MVNYDPLLDMFTAWLLCPVYPLERRLWGGDCPIAGLDVVLASYISARSLTPTGPTWVRNLIATVTNLYRLT